MRRATYALAAAILLAGVIASSGTSATYRDVWVSFRYPDSWRVYHWTIPSREVRYIAWVSNARLHDPCVRQRAGFDCKRPIDRLSRGGVLLTWLFSSLPVPEGHQQRSGIWITRPGSCEDVGAAETITRRFRDYVVEACIRGPGLKRTQQQVLAVLRSARFNTG
jgi:hypothetical protein